MKSLKVKLLVKIAILSAMAVILMYVEFPIPLFPPWLKIGFSDVPALFLAFSSGPVAGIFVLLIKNLLDIVLKGPSFGAVGQLANFLIGCCIVIPSAVIYRIKHNKKGAVAGLGIGVILTCAMAAILNVYLILPLSGISNDVLGGAMKPIVELFGLTGKIDPVFAYAVLAVVPFNLIKYLLESLVVLILYKRLSGLLHK